MLNNKHGISLIWQMEADSLRKTRKRKDTSAATEKHNQPTAEERCDK